MGLEDRIGRDYAAAWRPNEGETIIGTVVELSLRENEYGTYPIVTLQTKDGREVAVHAFHTTLLNGMKKARPNIGEEIAIKYEGKREPKSDKFKAYHSYRVLKEQTAETNFWGPTQSVSEQPQPQRQPQLNLGQHEFGGSDADTEEEPWS